MGYMLAYADPSNQIQTVTYNNGSWGNPTPTGLPPTNYSPALAYTSRDQMFLLAWKSSEPNGYIRWAISTDTGKTWSILSGGIILGATSQGGPALTSDGTSEFTLLLKIPGDSTHVQQYAGVGISWGIYNPEPTDIIVTNQCPGITTAFDSNKNPVLYYAWRGPEGDEYITTNVHNPIQSLVSQSFLSPAITYISWFEQFWMVHTGPSSNTIGNPPASEVIYWTWCPQDGNWEQSHSVGLGSTADTLALASDGFSVMLAWKDSQVQNPQTLLYATTSPGQRWPQQAQGFTGVQSITGPALCAF